MVLSESLAGIGFGERRTLSVSILRYKSFMPAERNGI